MNTFGLALTYNFLKGPLTPYVDGYIGELTSTRTLPTVRRWSDVIGTHGTAISVEWVSQRSLIRFSVLAWAEA